MEHLAGWLKSKEATLVSVASATGVLLADLNIAGLNDDIAGITAILAAGALVVSRVAQALQDGLNKGSEADD